MGKRKNFPKGREALTQYVLTHAKVMKDDTIYVVTPNGNWMLKENFLKKYA